MRINELVQKISIPKESGGYTHWSGWYGQTASVKYGIENNYKKQKHTFGKDVISEGFGKQFGLRALIVFICKEATDNANDYQDYVV